MFNKANYTHIYCYCCYRIVWPKTKHIRHKHRSQSFPSIYNDAIKNGTFYMSHLLDTRDSTLILSLSAVLRLMPFYYNKSIKIHVYKNRNYSAGIWISRQHFLRVAVILLLVLDKRKDIQFPIVYFNQKTIFQIYCRFYFLWWMNLWTQAYPHSHTFGKLNGKNYWWNKTINTATTKF